MILACRGSLLIYGDLHGLPPILIYVGGDEVLRDDSVRFAEKAKAVGGDVTLKVGEGCFIAIQSLAPLFPEATQAMDEICAFIKMHLTCSNDLQNNPIEPTRYTRS